MNGGKSPSRGMWLSKNVRSSLLPRAAFSRNASADGEKNSCSPYPPWKAGTNRGNCRVTRLSSSSIRCASKFGSFRMESSKASKIFLKSDSISLAFIKSSDNDSFVLLFGSQRFFQSERYESIRDFVLSETLSQLP